MFYVLKDKNYTNTRALDTTSTSPGEQEAIKGTGMREKRRPQIRFALEHMEKDNKRYYF